MIILIIIILDLLFNIWNTYTNTRHEEYFIVGRCRKIWEANKLHLIRNQNTPKSKPVILKTESYFLLIDSV